MTVRTVQILDTVNLLLPRLRRQGSVSSAYISLLRKERKTVEKRRRQNAFKCGYISCSCMMHYAEKYYADLEKSAQETWHNLWLYCFEAHFWFKKKKGGQSQQWKITTMSLISIQPGWSFFIMCVYAQVNTFFIIGSVTTYTYKRKNQDILEKLDASSSHNKQPCVRITFPKATI